MAAAVAVDEIDSIVVRVDDLHGRDERQPLLAVVVVRAAHAPVASIQNREGAVVAAKLDALLGEGVRGVAQEPDGDVGVDDDGIKRVAHAVAARLGVDDDVARLRQVGIAVDVRVADAGAADQHRHRRVLLDEADQLFAAARHDEVDVVLHLEHLGDDRAVAGLDDLHGARGHAGGGDRAFDHAAEDDVRLQRFLAAAEDRRAARLQAQRRDINRDVRPVLVDGADNAEGHAHLADHQAVGQRPHLDHLADRVGERRDVTHVVRDGGQPLSVQRQPVERGGREPVGAPALDVLRVRGQDLGLVRRERAGEAVQRLVLDRGGDRRQPPRRALRRLRFLFDFRSHCRHRRCPRT